MPQEQAELDPAAPVPYPRTVPQQRELPVGRLASHGRRVGSSSLLSSSAAFLFAFPVRKNIQSSQLQGEWQSWYGAPELRSQAARTLVLACGGGGVRDSPENSGELGRFSA